jgi:hypothetical protein
VADDNLDPQTADTQNRQDTDTPVEDWQQRYQSLQPEYTRATQTLKDREALMAHIEENFPDMLADDEEFDEDPPDDSEPVEPQNDPRFEQLTKAQQEQKQLLDALLEQQGLKQFNEDLDQWAAEADVTLTPRDRKILEMEMRQSNGDRDATKKAFDEHVEYVRQYEGQMAQTVREPRQRQAYMLEQYRNLAED